MNKCNKFLWGGYEGKMNILIVCSKEHAKYHIVMLESLYFNHPNEEIDIYVICKYEVQPDWSYFEIQAKQYNGRIIPLPVDDNIFAAFPGVTSKWPRILYFKLLAAELLPVHLDRVLFLESDMLITKSIKALYHMDFEENHIIACKNLVQYWGGNALRDQKRHKQRFDIPEQYDLFSGGMQVMNLAKWRKDGIGFEKITQLAEKFNYYWTVPDESLFVSLFYSSYKEVDAFSYYLLPVYWRENQRELDNKEDPYGSIVHYTICNKPWDSYVLDTECELDRIWWFYAKRTEFYDELRTRFESRLRTREDVKGLRQTLSNVDIYYQTIIRWKYMQDFCGQDALAKYFLTKGYKRVAVYGVNLLQLLFCNEINNHKDLSIPFIIDSYQDGKTDKYSIRCVDNCSFEEVDVVVVAAFLHLNAIMSRLQHVKCPVLSLQDVIDELLPNEFNMYVI
jgi:lipopolysaccharide biosynthesis glycosyltransferase